MRENIYTRELEKRYRKCLFKSMVFVRRALTSKGKDKSTKRFLAIFWKKKSESDYAFN